MPGVAHALGNAPQPSTLAGGDSGYSAAASSSNASVAATAKGSSAKSTQPANANAAIPVAPSDTPPAGRRLSPNQVLAKAERLPKMKAVRAKYPGSYGGAYLKMPFHWQVSYFSKNGKKEIGQVIIDDLSGRVLEQWTGFQVAWTMARGYPGAFGRHVNALYIWLPMCLLFMLPFFNFRRPLRLLHLDLLVLLSLSVSLAFFNHGHIYQSVPLVYPPLLYLLARMLALSRTGRRRDPGPLHLLVPAPWLALGVIFLIGFRVALNVTDGNVIDVGYAGVIGGERIVDGKSLYGHWPSDNEHGDTYGPVNYEAYVPFQQLFGWSGKWDDLPAAHAAAIAFDLLAMALLFLIGRRVRGPSLGVALVYAWAAFPFTLFSLESNSNDTLVAVLVLAAVLAATYRSRLAAPARGAFTALAGLTKFAPLALVPVLTTYGLWDGSDGTPVRRRVRNLATFAIAFVLAVAVASIPALSHDSLHTIYERTFAYQADRESPFSVWGLYGGLGTWEAVVEIAAVVLAVALAVIPRRADVVALAAACGATIIAVQLGIEHWFYLYIPWFFPLVMIALLGGFGAPLRRRTAAASEPARSHQPAAAVSS
jgi:Glycosyltransferase family 87